MIHIPELHKFSRWLTRKILSRFEKPKVEGQPEGPPADAPVLGRYWEEAFGKPLNETRIPEKGDFNQPVEYYAKMYNAAVSLYDNSPSKGDGSLLYGCQVHAEWGMIYAGAAAVPYALEMLKSPVPEARESGASILATVGREESVIDALLAAFEEEYEGNAAGDAEKENVQALDSMIEALGKMKNRKAIPALAKVVRNSAMDNDSRWLAMQNLGRLVRRRFDKGTDPMDAAIQWLDGHGF